MSWRRDAGARLLAGLMLTLAGAEATADAGLDTLALLEVVVNGRATQRIEPFAIRGGLPYAAAGQWRSLGVALDAGDDRRDLSVAALPEVQHRLDLGHQVLALELPPDPAARTLIDRGLPAEAPVLDQDPGVLLNYDLTAQRSEGRSLAAGLLELRAFGPLGVVEHALLARTGAVGGGSTRLSTSYTQVDPQRLRRWRVGDLVSGSLAWSRALRLGGGQLATDFGLRPGLVVTPTPQLSGQAAVPSTVDVLVNGVRQLSQPVEPGAFEVRQLPSVNGLGEVSVVVRDALGRERVQTLAFYTASRQLARGMTAFSLEGGRLRLGYGSDASRYGAGAASATWRHGWSDRVTLEAHGEAGAGTAAAGGGAVLTVGSLGLLSAAVARSGGAGRQGWLANVGAERQTPVTSLQLSLTGASRDYRDVAGAAGDPALRHSARVGAGWQLGAAGSVGIALLDQRSDAGSAGLPALRTRLVSATQLRPLGGGAQLFVNAYRDIAGGGQGASIGVVLPIGPRGSGSAMVTRTRDGSSLGLAAGESATTSGEFGWRVQREQPLAGPSPTHQMLQAETLTPVARLSAGAETLAGHTTLRLGAQGALLTLGGGWQATQTVQDGFAVVEVDQQPGVTVFHEHRPIGRTDRDGRLVVPGLLSFQDNRLSIEPLDLPLDAEAATLEREVRPGDRSGVRVRFALDRTRAALVVLSDARGRPLPVGARIAGDGARPPAVVGHEGMAWLRGLGEHDRVQVVWAQGRCSAQVDWRDRQPDTGRIGPVRCE